MKRKAARRTVAIVGTGLIGASIGLALRRAASGYRVIGWDVRRQHTRAAKARGALHEVAPSLDRAIAAAEIIILASPLEGVLELLPRVMQKARPAALVMDVAGLKQPVLAAAAKAMTQTIEEKGKPFAAFVGGHPLAGSERRGAANATPDLFRDRPFALCAPRQKARPAALRRAAAFVRLLRAKPIVTDARNHDRIVAATSALPQLASSALSLAVSDAGITSGKFAGPGYDSMTRLALCEPGLWAGSLLENKRNVSRALAVFETRVREFGAAVEQSDPKVLSRLLRSAAAQRQRLRRG